MLYQYQGQGGNGLKDINKGQTAPRRVIFVFYKVSNKLKTFEITE